MPQKNIKLDKDGVKVVRFFMSHPDREMSSDDVSKDLKLDEVDAEIILKGLEKAGFLDGKGKGLTYQYRVSDKVLATRIEATQGNDDSTRYIG